MTGQIVGIIINFIVTSLLGYSVAIVKNYKKKNNSIEKALMTMLQSNLTNTYFVYEKLEAIPDYVYKNWLNELKEYESLGGDDYVHTLAEKMKNWDIVRTDILEGGH